MSLTKSATIFKLELAAIHQVLALEAEFTLAKRAAAIAPPKIAIRAKLHQSRKGKGAGKNGKIGKKKN